MKKLIWLLPVVALIISCGGEDGDDYYPVAVGNQWEYSIVNTLNVTAFTDTTFSYTGTSTTTITGQAIFNNIEAFELVTITIWDDTVAMTNSTDTSYVQATNDYVLIYEDLTDTEPDTSLVFPLETGNTWIVRIDSTDTLTAEVLGQETITVPAGAFADCWTVEYTYNGWTEQSWLALDVGIVRDSMITDVQNGTSLFDKELLNANIQ